MDEQIEEAKKKSLSNRMLEAGETALAIGAGAVFLYRSGGAKVLSDGMETAKRFLTRAHSDLSAQAVGEHRSQGILGRAQTLKEIWKEVKSDVRRQNIGLRENDHRNLFGLLGEIRRIKENPDAYLTDMYQREKLINPTLELMQTNFSMNAVAERKLSNFIEGLPAKLGDEAAVVESMNRMRFSDAEKNIAARLTDYMQSRDSVEGRRSFRVQNETLVRQVLDVAQDLSQWERRFGTANTSGSSLLDRLRGDRAATIGDILAHADQVPEAKTYYKAGSEHKFEETISMLKRMQAHFKEMSQEHEERFMALTPDAAVLRKDTKGNLYSFKAAADLLDRALDFAAGTLPGKLLKMRDAQYAGKSPVFQYIGRGSHDPILAALTNRGGVSSRVEETYWRVMDRVYRSTAGGIEHIEEADQTFLVSGNYGTRAKLMRQMMGHNAFRESSIKLKRILDIDQDGEIPYYRSLASRWTKHSDDMWIGNVMRRFLVPTKAETAEYELAERSTDISYAVSYLRRARAMNSFFGKNTYALGSESAQKMAPHAAGEAKQLLEKLRLDDETLLHAILTPEAGSIGHTDRWMNRDLASLLHRYVVDPKKALDAVTLKTDRTQFWGQGKETTGFYDLLRMELGKEAFLQHAAQETGTKKYMSILDLIDNAEIKGRQKTEAKRLGYWAAYQHITGIAESSDLSYEQKSGRIWKNIRAVHRLFQQNTGDAFAQDFQKMVGELVQERTSSLEAYARNTDTAGAVKYNSYIHLQKMVTPLDVLRNLNNTAKAKALAGKFVRQINAGGKDPQNITSATLYPYFFFARLSDDLNKVGLGFSRKSMDSTGSLIKNLMIKRVAPVGIAMTYYDWLDDTAKELTGTSFTGAFANGLANTDLAYRRVSDAVGLTEILKDEKAMNPALQYYFGKDEYQDFAQRKKYYESGYDPMRKGRYWTFGGVNEFRGGQIAYWEPNFVRRLNSDYQDRALYDGYWDKWSHSWLPTPANPLSPVFALMDPYWLEKRHAEDRPYPVSGTLFSEGTPWGVVLNPTIGEWIKPQKELHSARLESGRDANALVLAMNQEIRRRAMEKAEENLVVLKGAQLTPLRFTPYNAPTPQERIYSLRFEEGALASAIAADFGYYDGGVTPDVYLSDSKASVKPLKLEQGAAPESPRLTTAQTLEIEAATGNLPAQIAMNFVKSVRPLESIKRLNREIMSKAQFDRSQGVMTPQKLASFKVSEGMALLEDTETVDELLHISSGQDLIRESALSMRLLFGIYGYGANRLTGFGDNTQRRIATSADMNSPFRTFWDSGFGGFGGETMEIARRFMPDYKRSTRVNPLLNQMPDWLPERIRFGDPYTVVPKGEMRLPGKGYESLNRLHPDQFGQYGAFDRFKILADVAPYSPEYKIWKAIAQKTVMTRELKDEMKEVKERAALQGKQHEFYDYRFLGRGLEYQQGTVTQVLDRGKFKIYGSDRVYRLAGIKFKAIATDAKDTREILNDYLHVGQEVNLAIDANEAYRFNNDADQSINAAVYVNGQNLGAQLLDAGIAERRKGDTSAAATIGQFSALQRLRGSIYEWIAHLDVPWLSDQYLRVRSPLESYKAEQVYGTPYQTWSDPIGTFLLPAFERSISDHRAVNAGQIASYLHRLSENVAGIGPTGRKMLTGAYMLSNRGAFMGGALAYLVKPESGRTIRSGAHAGSLLMTLGNLYSGLNDPFESALGFGQIGYTVTEILKKSQKKGVAAGAALGIALYGANHTVFESSKPWIPERIERKWNTQEYFDRLAYIKYSGLYKRAADKALENEGVDIDALVRKREKDTNEMRKIRETLLQAKEKLSLLPNGVKRNQLESLLRGKLNSLQASQAVLRGGPWTQSALVYKQARESTMYGLPADATWTQIVRAVPKLEREYFLEFVKERDVGRRQEILQYSSPLLQRALKRAWAVQQEEMEENESYFAKHHLPSFTWSGWRPDVDLADVEIKTIANEGMLLGDFGHYESRLREEAVVNAPTLELGNRENALLVQANLAATLRGLGLTGVDVSVQPAPITGVEVIANVQDIASHAIKKTIFDIFQVM